MNTRRPAKVMSAILLLGALIFGLSQVEQTRAQQNGSKDTLTPAFWQRDPEANFEDEGRMHCAPTSVSDGLIYLTQAYGLQGLVPGIGHEDQIKLIQELAEDFGTDPSIGGTNPDKILTGLQTYMEKKGFELSRLELKTWRKVSASNKSFKIGTRPDIAWMRSAAGSRDTVVLFNFGWYKQDGDSYKRTGGHWINVVGASGTDFIVHNPLLPPEKQSENKLLKLTLLDDDFIADTGSSGIASDAKITTAEGEGNFKGFYTGDGSGLPHGKAVTAILDAVIVFTLKKTE